MSDNTKRTSATLASQAAKVLQDANASVIARKLAGGVLSQRDGDKQTSAAMEDIAAKVLQSEKYAARTVAFAASLVAQANKER